jgi:2,3-bisphosphoglycerate-independent phosphoglycerate mutase
MPRPDQEDQCAMKYAIILPDGAADEPLPQLNGRTPLEAARIPNMTWVAQHGRLGRVLTVPTGFTPGTDVATLVLFGYDPHTYYSGRAPIEAAARGIRVAPDELVFRCNFVTILDGRMRDFTAGHIPQPEADRLIADLNALVQAGEPALRGCMFYNGVSYRNLMVAANAVDLQLTCAPPHDIPNHPVADHQPRGRGEQRARAVMDRARQMLRDHAVNRTRQTAGRDPVTDIWLWGQGQPRNLPLFAERFGVRGAVITGVDILRGLAVMMGMNLIEVPGATGYIDTNYAGKGEAAVRALAEHDLIAVHVEAADEAGHLGNAAEKVKALERIDELIVGPLLAALCRHDEWRMLVAPDHPTPVTTTAHDATPPPFCFAGTGVPAGGNGAFSEREAVAAGLFIDPGHRLMEQFIR